MKLSDLIKGARLPLIMNNGVAGGTTVSGSGGVPDVEFDIDPEIEGVYYRAQNVAPGGLFVAVKGFAANGHDFIGKAIERGAVAVICERPVQGKAVMVQVDNTRKALASVSASFFGHPSRELTLIGITGTNGKTTTSYLIESILARAGFQTGVIGTINYRFCGQVFDNPVTTPESFDVQRILANMCDAGVTHAVMEVSSHALDLYRVHGCAFDIGVLTNFTQDHLDYHKDMAAYWSCKRRLFTDFLPASTPFKRPRAVINGDDPKGKSLRNTLDLPVLTTGHHKSAEVQSQQSRFDLEGISANIKTPLGILKTSSHLVGRHNLENILNAVGVGISLELPLETIAAGIEALASVPGRLERIPNRLGRYVYVDYAHTPDALENALLALRSLTAERIICVFGCGGDRDRDKRPQMGAIAARLSDLAIVTSDNPRTEPPERIISEIEAGVRRETQRLFMPAELKKGFSSRGYVLESDRQAAITLSIQCSRPGDTVLIAGKGHEPYQIIGQQKFDFDDRKVALEAMAA